MVLGHETAGIVAAVGPEVEDLQVGDRVCIEPGETCRKCDTCKLGQYNLCKVIKFAATPPTDGTLAGYVSRSHSFEKHGHQSDRILKNDVQRSTYFLQTCATNCQT